MKKFLNKVFFYKGRNTRIRYAITFIVTIFAFVILSVWLSNVNKTMIEIGRTNNREAFKTFKYTYQFARQIFLPATLLIVWISIVNFIRRLHDINLPGGIL